MLRSLMLAGLVLIAGTATAQTQPLPNTAVAQLDLQRYSGQWHQIAHLPMFFQRNCVADTTATYTPRENGQITVRNACSDRTGRRIVAEGVARTVTGYPGRLQVRFAPRWIGWLPMVWADYWVVDLDPDYQWAVVGEPGRTYLWILSRTPSLPRAQFDAIRERAARRGYPVERLVIAPNAVIE